MSTDNGTVISKLKQMQNDMQEIDRLNREKDQVIAEKQNYIKSIRQVNLSGEKPVKNTSRSGAIAANLYGVKRSPIKHIWIGVILGILYLIVGLLVLMVNDYLFDIDISDADTIFLLILPFIMSILIMVYYFRRSTGASLCWAIVLALWGTGFAFVPSSMMDSDDAVLTCVIQVCIVWISIVSKLIFMYNRDKKIDAIEVQLQNVKKEEDINFNRAMETYRQRCQGASEQAVVDNKENIEKYDLKVREISQKIVNAEQRIRSNDIVSQEDKSRNLVSFVLKKLETGRADSLKEALQLYDDEMKRIDDDNRRYMREEQERRRRAREEAEAYLNQTIHNWKVERELQKQTDEIERMRKDQEFYQRYGQPR